MEIYQIYNFVSTFFEVLFETLAQVNPNFTGGFPNNAVWLGTSLAIAGGIWLALYLLQSFGLYYMAKKQGLEKRYLAFIPFANTLYMSKLAGKCSFFGRRMKYAGVYAMISQILLTVVCGMVIAAQMYLYIACGHQMNEITETIGGVEVVTGVYWSNLTGFGIVAYNFYNYSSYLVSIFELAYEVFMLVVMVALLKKYAPKNYFLLSFLVLFVPISRYIVIFALKNKQPIDYEAWLAKRRADYFHRQQQYNSYGGGYGSPYGNPYGNPQNGQGWQNGQNPQGGQNNQNGQNAPADDPFEEFSSNGANPNGQGENTDASAGGNSQTAGGEGDDGFFN